MINHKIKIDIFENSFIIDFTKNIKSIKIIALSKI